VPYTPIFHTSETLWTRLLSHHASDKSEEYYRALLGEKMKPLAFWSIVLLMGVKR
jgi:hypothetical protein